MKFLFFLFVCLGIGIGLYINAQESLIQPHEAQKIYAPQDEQTNSSNSLFGKNPRESSGRWDLVIDQDKPAPFIIVPAVERTRLGLEIVFGTILCAAVTYAFLFGKGNNVGVPSEPISAAPTSRFQSPMVIHCPQCKHQLRIPGLHQVARLRCPACKHLFNFPLRVETEN
jgi:hypothetical protein